MPSDLALVRLKWKDQTGIRHNSELGIMPQVVGEFRLELAPVDGVVVVGMAHRPAQPLQLQFPEPGDLHGLEVWAEHGDPYPNPWAGGGFPP